MHPGRRGELPPIPGLTVEVVPLDISRMLDHHWITGNEPTPPLPDVEMPRQLAAALMEVCGLPLASGGLLEELTSTTLAEVGAGFRDWRLLGCEPFHVAGTMRTLRLARRVMHSGAVRSPEARDAGVVEPAQPSLRGGDGLPALTQRGKQALQAAQQGVLAVWNERLKTLEPVTGRLVAGLEARGLGQTHSVDGGLLPALSPGVLAAVTALPPSKLGAIRAGRFCNNLPLHRVVERAGVTGVRRHSAAFGMRLAAAIHLRRERDKIIAELGAECALADMGLIEPGGIGDILRDGASLADHALPLLRLVWLDRWLRG